MTECLRKGAWHKAPDDSQILLTTYDRILDLSRFRATFEIVVFDEAHNLKNVCAARTKAAAQIARRFTLCLTGTPVENNASEFYSVMSAAVPGIFGTLKAFKEYFREAPDRILGRSRPFILRRTKDKILKDLPKRKSTNSSLKCHPCRKRSTRAPSLRSTEVAEAYEVAPNNKLASLRSLRFYAYARCVSPNGQKTATRAKLATWRTSSRNFRQKVMARSLSQFIGGLDQMEVVAKRWHRLPPHGRTPQYPSVRRSSTLPK